MGRRKSTANKKKDGLEDSFDEESAIEIYKRRKSYERAENPGLETVFEATENEESRRTARASKAKLMPKLRMITSQPYFIEDSEKNALRKKQTAKLFKGRKKMKWKGLSAKQEEKLLTIIQDKSDSEDNESDVSALREEKPEEQQSSNSGKTLMPFVLSDSQNSSNLCIKLSDSSLYEPSLVPTPTSMPKRAPRTPLKETPEADFSLNIKEADAFLGPLGFSDDEDEGEGSSEFKPRLAEERGKENITKNDRRKSKIARVRRSSRLFRGDNPTAAKPLQDQTNQHLGTVYQDIEIIDRRASRRSKMFSKPNMNCMDKSLDSCSGGSTPIANEELFALYKTDSEIVST